MSFSSNKKNYGLLYRHSSQTITRLKRIQTYTILSGWYIFLRFLLFVLYIYTYTYTQGVSIAKQLFCKILNYFQVYLIDNLLLNLTYLNYLFR